MTEKEILENSGQPDAEGQVEQDTVFDSSAETGDSETSAKGGRDKEVEKLKADVAEFKEKYLRQVAEFDNFRKRNARERIELIQTAGREVIESLLDIMDDCDRAQVQLEKGADHDSTREGVMLVFNKLRNTLHAKGLRPMECKGQEFNPDLHEAVTEVPVPSEMKGKVVDELQKGYYLNDKIIRFAKVVVGK